MKNYTKMMRYAARAFGRGVRVHAELDIGRARDEAENTRTRLGVARMRLAEMQLSGKAKPEEMDALRGEIERDAQRYSDLMNAVTAAEGEQGARVAGAIDFDSPDMGLRISKNGLIVRDVRDALGFCSRVSPHAMGGLYRALLTGEQPDASVRAELSLPTTVTTGTATGGYLLPKNVSDRLIRDIVEDDSILDAITVTAVTGLELPKVSTEDVDDDDVDDATPAPDAKPTASMINFGRNPYAKCVPVPNSLLADTNTAIASYIDVRHTEMMRARMCKRLTATAPTGKYTHMSVYSPENAIKKASGETLLDGILAAISDLPTRPKGVYKVALSLKQWTSMIKALANGATSLFAAPSKEILGFEPVICGYVDKPIVGNLKTIHLNYDSGVVYESERHAKGRFTDFVLSTYYDIQIEQPELLRIVEVGAQPAQVSSETSTGGEGGKS